MNFLQNKNGSDNRHYQQQSDSKKAFLPIKAVEKVKQIGSDKDFLILLQHYFETEVLGLSTLSIKAKREDLQKFLNFYYRINGHLKADEWMVRDTKMFIDELIKNNYASSTINRVLATVRSFGRWVRDEGIISHDPTKKIKELQLPVCKPKRIDDLAYHRLMKAAEVRIAKPRSEISQDFRQCMKAASPFKA